MRTILIAMTVACVACEQGREAPGGDVVEEDGAVAALATGGCTVVQVPPQQAPNQISPKSAIASDYTRPVFPMLAKAGSWSTAQYVMDGNGLALPGIVASGSNAGLLQLPFISGDVIVGVTMTVCGDAATYIMGNVVASQVFNPPPSTLNNLTDMLTGVGSTASRGPAAVWHDVDIGMETITLSDQSMLWLQLSALPGSSGAPISMAVGRVIMHLNH